MVLIQKRKLHCNTWKVILVPRGLIAMIHVLQTLLIKYKDLGKNMLCINLINTY